MTDYYNPNYPIDDEFVDADGEPVDIGTIMQWTYGEEADYDDEFGTVVEFGEWDVDDSEAGEIDGKVIPIPPRICVKWIDGITEWFDTFIVTTPKGSVLEVSDVIEVRK
jgi:hypothetical protein